MDESCPADCWFHYGRRDDYERKIENEESIDGNHVVVGWLVDAAFDGVSGHGAIGFDC